MNRNYVEVSGFLSGLFWCCSCSWLCGVVWNRSRNCCSIRDHDWTGEFLNSLFDGRTNWLNETAPCMQHQNWYFSSCIIMDIEKFKFSIIIGFHNHYVDRCFFVVVVFFRFLHHCGLFISLSLSASFAFALLIFPLHRAPRCVFGQQHCCRHWHASPTMIATNRKTKM